MTCPKCQSDDWKLTSLIFSQGVSLSSSSSQGIGIGTGGVGVGAATTSGVTQSRLSMMAAPPTAPNAGRLPTFALFVGALGGTLFCASLDMGQISSVAVGLVIGLAAAWFVLQKLEGGEKLAAYESELKRWQEQRMCQRCGTFFQATDIADT